MLPSRRKRPKMGVQKPPRTIYPVHRAYVKRHVCAIPNCPHVNDIIDFAHAKTRGSGGHDCQGVPFCRTHHREQHTIGIESMMAKYRVNLFAMGAEFARTTTDKALRLAMKEDPTLGQMGMLASRHSNSLMGGINAAP